MTRLPLLALIALLLTPATWGAELSLQIEVPRLKVAEYHRPYVAVWIEDDSRRSHGSLAVWYDVGMADGEGQKWLKDLREWWRRDGRGLSFPLDGVTSATRAPGRHTVTFKADHPQLAALPAGDYLLTLEAAREVGGRERLTLPFSWPPPDATSTDVQGTQELGAVRLTSSP